jgi:quercetin dioxygenase-like cupin family protein
MRFTSGAESVEAEAGAVVVAPAGTPHTFSNPFDAPATFLCSVTPDLYIQYFRDLGTLPVDARGQLAPGEVGRIMARYATEVVRAG